MHNILDSVNDYNTIYKYVYKTMKQEFRPQLYIVISKKFKRLIFGLFWLTLSDPPSNLVRQYDFPVPFRCRKMSETVFVAFVRPVSESVRRFFSCSTDFSQQIAQVVLFPFLHVFLF
jgi:hypothetical protein